jgi:hypothetical protein
MQLQNIETMGPAAGVTGRVCRKIDVNCADPENTSVSDETGKLVLEIMPDPAFPAFQGYVTLEREGMLPGLYFFNPPVDRDESVSVQLASPGIAATLTALLGATMNPERGLILVYTEDCKGTPTAGVRLRTDDVDSAAILFYASGGLPVPTATMTDKDGYGGYVNVNAGPVTLAGEVPEMQRDLGTVSIVVKPGTISYSRMVPLGK